MGQEIDHVSFTPAERAEFARRLAMETEALIAECARRDTTDDIRLLGLELETCLVDRDTLSPSMCNQAFLSRLDSPLASAELAQHNAEFNFDPLPVRDNMLGLLHAALRRQYTRAREVAAELGCDIALCGILPTLDPSVLTLSNISPLNRYFALNRQVMDAHQNMGFQLEIKGRDHLIQKLDSVMMEAAATSLQIHLRLPADRMRFAYNAAQLVSAPTVALSANSPLLFGRDLWAETRIPLFEQAIGLGGLGAASQGPLHRVSFGSGYAKRGLVECFEENLSHYPVLLPILDDSGARFAHLRLHNGTIWRWNRPIVGFDEDGGVHLRLEHRTLPSGPSLIDMVANTALFVGLVRHYMDHDVESLEFARTRSNFYEAARYGLSARIDWLDGQRHPVCRLLHKTLLPAAANGLDLLGIDPDDRDRYLDVLERRLESGQNGAVWQRRFLARYPDDLVALTAAMLEQQACDTPVHLWE
jgi:gamma-glutamyl:cysteine ligase YbdK (ATP-grasp superfamily)